MDNGDVSGGTGQQLTRATIIIAGVASLMATLLSLVSVWFQLKNYRKPLLQRYVVRILLMVPIYSIASWCSLVSLKVAFYVDPIRDIYEAFTIYTFLQLLINFIGGERALIIMTHGREPVSHLWPLNHCLAKIDISDPHTFLSIKRGILQYAYLKPILGISTIVMKSTGVYQEGYIGVTSGYFWSGLIYNVSITWCLYALGLFWVCMLKDLQPFRPMPKFLCIKLVIFAAYWQGFLLSIFVWLGALPNDVQGYTPDNLAAAIQDALICCEMPAFAIAHWYAFSWHDYADKTISAARMPVTYAFRDAFGCQDLIEDTKETFSGKKYEYRLFDSGDNVIAHEESSSRVKRMMEGMRYERNGKGKYWIPKPGEPTSRTPLLAGVSAGGANINRNRSPQKSGHVDDQYIGYGNGAADDLTMDPEEEDLYVRARRLEFGDWNYPVITAHQASRDNWLRQDPNLLSTSANRHLLQPTGDNQVRRLSNIHATIQQVTKKKHKGKNRENSTTGNGEEGRAPMPKGMLRQHSSASSSNKSDRSQLVDLVVEDETAEDTERVRARKEGSSGWNETEPRRFVRTYPGENQGEDIREGFEPTDDTHAVDPKEGDSNNDKFRVDDDDSSESEEAREWKAAKEAEAEVTLKPKYGVEGEDFANVWSQGEPSSPPRENP